MDEVDMGFSQQAFMPSLWDIMIPISRMTDQIPSIEPWGFEKPFSTRSLSLSSASLQNLQSHWVHFSWQIPDNNYRQGFGREIIIIIYYLLLLSSK